MDTKRPSSRGTRKTSTTTCRCGRRTAKNPTPSRGPVRAPAPTPSPSGTTTPRGSPLGGPPRSFPTWNPGVPELKDQDLNKIDAAFKDFTSSQELLGGHPVAGSRSKIADLVNKINGRSGQAGDFAEWAGVSGDTFNNNFGQYVDPTMENQTAIGPSLANLYSGRACLIEAARGNTLAAIQRATKALGATVDSGAELATWNVAASVRSLWVLPAPGSAWRCPLRCWSASTSMARPPIRSMRTKSKTSCPASPMSC